MLIITVILVIAFILTISMVVMKKKVKKKMEAQEDILYIESSTEQEKNQARKELKKLEREYKKYGGK